MATMAIRSVTDDYEIEDVVPDGADPHGGYSVEITYTWDGKDRHFRYFESPLVPYVPVLLAPTPELNAGLFYSSREFSDDLDLVVDQDCIISISTDHSLPLFWPTDGTAVMTKDATMPYYYELRHIHGGTQYKKNEFPKGVDCRQICFSAMRNDGGTVGDTHRFSLRLKARDGHNPQDVYIDPDIKNPSS